MLVIIKWMKALRKAIKFLNIYKKVKKFHKK